MLDAAHVCRVVQCSTAVLSLSARCESSFKNGSQVVLVGALAMIGYARTCWHGVNLVLEAYFTAFGQATLHFAKLRLLFDIDPAVTWWLSK